MIEFQCFVVSRPVTGAICDEVRHNLEPSCYYGPLIMNITCRIRDLVRVCSHSVHVMKQEPHTPCLRKISGFLSGEDPGPPSYDTV
jgi:hypothetical protein